MGGVRAGCMPPLLKDSERGGKGGSEGRLGTLCWGDGELCLFILERSSTWDRSHNAVTQTIPANHASVHHIATCKSHSPYFLSGHQTKVNLTVGQWVQQIIIRVYHYHSIVYFGITLARHFSRRKYNLDLLYVPHKGFSVSEGRLYVCVYV